jgi:acetyltransferase-like isoleucine patch superfamily enzyme
MTRLFIFGTGAHARKVFHCAATCGYRVEAFVDENPAAIAPIPSLLVLDAGVLPVPTEGDCMFVAIGRADVRRRLMDRLDKLGWELPALVHEAAWVAPDARLGAGVLVAAGAVVETASTVGRGAIIDIGVLVDHECNIGAFCHLRPGEVLGPRTRRDAAA